MRHHLPHGLGLLVAVNDVFFEKLNVPAAEHGPHTGFVEEAFGTGSDVMEVLFDLQFRRRAVVMVMGGVEAGEQDDVHAVGIKRERLAVVQLDVVGAGRAN